MSSKAKTSTAITTVEAANFPALVGDNVAETIRFNMGGESVGPADLTRIKVPSGGGTIWSVVNADGDEEPERTLQGIIVHIGRRRAFWASAEPSGEPPACSSSDCLHGIGNPGGNCETCPLNQFGSAHKQDGTAGRGKACKETKLLFILREGQFLPDVVSVPASSLRAMRQWQLKLGVPYWSILTGLTLEKCQNKDGINYATVKPVKLATLPAEVGKQIVDYANAMSAVFSAVTVDAGDVAGEEV